MTKKVQYILFIILVINGQVFCQDSKNINFQEELWKLQKRYVTLYEGNAINQWIENNQKQLNILKQEALKQEKIWDLQNNSTLFMLMSKPYFDYPECPNETENAFFLEIIIALLQSNRYKADKQLAAETFRAVLHMLADSKYHHLHGKLLWIFMHSLDLKYLKDINNQSFIKKEINNRISTKIDKRNVYFLVFYWLVEWSNIEIQNQRKILNTTQMNLYGITMNDRYRMIPLLIQIQLGKKDAIENLSSLLKNLTHSKNDYMNARAILPMLSLVRTNEMVKIIAPFLEDNNIVYNGSDVIPKYSGLSCEASKVLSTMIYDFPDIYEKAEISVYNGKTRLENTEEINDNNFTDEDDYYVEDKAYLQSTRIKHINWIKQNHKYSFKPIIISDKNNHLIQIDMYIKSVIGQLSVPNPIFY